MNVGCSLINNSSCSKDAEQRMAVSVPGIPLYTCEPQSPVRSEIATKAEVNSKDRDETLHIQIDLDREHWNITQSRR